MKRWGGQAKEQGITQAKRVGWNKNRNCCGDDRNREIRISQGGKGDGRVYSHQNILPWSFSNCSAAPWSSAIAH